MLRSLAAFAILSTACSPRAQLSIEQAVETHLAANKVPGCSVAIFQDGKLAYSRGFGWADVEAKRPVTEDTLFRLGSVSKSVTAVAAMRLVEADKFELEDDVSQWVPKFPSGGSPITVGALLSHRSGIRHYASVGESLLDREYKTLTDATEVFSADPFIAKPGEKFSYSTHAYTLLGAAMEQLTGSTFPELVATLSKAAGAKTIRCEVLSTTDPARSTLYEGPDGREADPQKPVNNSWKYPGGGMESTAADLARFGASLLSGELLSPTSLERMWTPPKVANGSPQPYALGWRPSTGAFGKTVEHGGAQQGCRSLLRIYRDRGTVLVILSNRSGHSLDGLAKHIESAWFAKKP